MPILRTSPQATIGFRRVRAIRPGVRGSLLGNAGIEQSQGACRKLDEYRQMTVSLTRIRPAGWRTINYRLFRSTNDGRPTVRRVTGVVGNFRGVNGRPDPQSAGWQSSGDPSRAASETWSLPLAVRTMAGTPYRPGSFETMNRPLPLRSGAVRGGRRRGWEAPVRHITEPAGSAHTRTDRPLGQFRPGLHFRSNGTTVVRRRELQVRCYRTRCSFAGLFRCHCAFGPEHTALDGFEQAVRSNLCRAARLHSFACANQLARRCETTDGFTRHRSSCELWNRLAADVGLRC